MAQTIKIDNFKSPNIVEEAIVSADVAAGANSFSVVNSDSFAAANPVVLGNLGAESSEKVTVSSIAASVISISGTLARQHYLNDKATVIFGNQIKVYRAANVDGTPPADADFAVFSGSTINIDWDNVATTFSDPAGSSSYWYKYTYFNSVSSAESALADSIAVRGGGVGNYCSIEDIRREAGFQHNRNISDNDIDFYRQSAQGEINGTLIGTYTIPFTSPVPQLIKYCAVKLAAGYLLTRNYGPTSTLNTNQGQQKIDEIVGTKDKPGILDKLNNKTLTMADYNGNDISIQTDAGIFNAWPDSSTADALPEDGGGARMFRISDRY